MGILESTKRMIKDCSENVKIWRKRRVFMVKKENVYITKII
jgi:hypothetical protein